MTDGLFSRDVGVKVGDIFTDIEIEKSGIPDPMAKVRVEEVDEVGMIHLVSAWAGNDRRIIVSPKTLNERFRRR